MKDEQGRDRGRLRDTGEGAARGYSVVHRESSTELREIQALRAVHPSRPSVAGSTSAFAICISCSNPGGRRQPWRLQWTGSNFRNNHLAAPLVEKKRRAAADTRRRRRLYVRPMGRRTGCRRSGSRSPNSAGSESTQTEFMNGQWHRLDFRSVASTLDARRDAQVPV